PVLRQLARHFEGPLVPARHVVNHDNARDVRDAERPRQVRLDQIALVPTQRDRLADQALVTHSTPPRRRGDLMTVVHGISASPGRVSLAPSDMRVNVWRGSTMVVICGLATLSGWRCWACACLPPAPGLKLAGRRPCRSHRRFSNWLAAG